MLRGPDCRPGDPLAQPSRTVRRLTSAAPGNPGFDINLDAIRREAAFAGPPVIHGLPLLLHSKATARKAFDSRERRPWNSD